MSKRVWEVCEPHPDVYARDMDPSMFAASLHAVEVGTANEDYTDPERFFAKTYMTRSLEDLLVRVLARLMGQHGRGAPVLRLETPFGGGKTHALVALYHLARQPEKVEETESGTRLRELLNIAHLPRDIKVAVLDGAALDPQGREVNGLTIRTLWGELAYRLGGKNLYKVVQKADESRISPGEASLFELLTQAKPVLILMDEFIHYLAKARGVRVGDTNLAVQTLAFLRELTVAVTETPQTTLVLSLPSSSLEVPAESPAQAEEMFQSVHKIVGRTELVETPVAEDEVFGVLQRRLFKKLGDERTAKKVVQEFQNYYEEYARFFPETLRNPQYRERMLNAYPFHPELVDLLYQRWGPHPQFQRTRGALRLMALVLRRLWNQRPGSAYLIQPHHIDLADRHIRAEVIRLLDGAFDAVVTGDVLERAHGVDRELGSEYQRERLAEQAAAIALLYSVPSGTEQLGCTEEELRVALLRPNINPTQATEVLGRLRNQLWYMRYRDHYYFFTTKPNLNKVILDFEHGVSEDEVQVALQDFLRQIVGPERGGEIAVYIAPEDPDAVAEPTRATLVVLPLTLDSEQQALEWMKRVVARITARNLLVFLAPDQGRKAQLRVSVRRLLALQALQKSQAFQAMDEEDKEEVKKQLKDKNVEVQGLLFETYARVFRPAEDGVSEIRIALKRANKTLAETVAEGLKERGLLLPSLAPQYIAQTFGIEKRQVSLPEIQTVITGSPGQPLLSDPQQALREAIKAGVEQGLFAVRAGKETFTQKVPDEVLKRPDVILLPPVKEIPKKALHQEGPTGRIVLQVTTTATTVYPLRILLEKLQGEDIKIHVVLDDQSGKLAAKREEIERILRDYSIPHDWREQVDETLL